jgi:2-iminobutanoate/2-iminopropanoate deaminase
MSNQTFGPYSPIREAGGLYFVSGQIGVDPATKSAREDVQAQTKQALDNLAGVLKTAELTLADVVKTTVFVTDMSDFAAVNEVYLGYFDDPRPARSCVAVRELPRVGAGVPLRVEIEAIALRPTS